MNSETKFFAGIIGATFVMVAAAAIIFSRPVNVPQVDPGLLVKEDSYRFGSPSAAVTLVEFGDLQCPACAAYHLVVKQLMDTYSGSLSLVFRHFPLNIHPNAVPASKAVEAAGKQGKFWEMYNKIYENQNEWSAEKDTTGVFAGYAQGLGLDVDQFKKDLDDEEIRKKIDRDIAGGMSLGINSTPTFYLNNEKIRNPASLEEFETLIRAAIAKSATPGAASESGSASPSSSQ